MTKIKKTRVLKKLNELEVSMANANEQIFDIRNSVKTNGEYVNFSDLKRLKASLETTLLELDNLRF